MAAWAGHGTPASELARQLAADIERVVEAVLVDCRREGSEMRGHGGDGALWVVETRGRKRGVALCAHDPDRSGDALALVAEALHGGDRRAAYRWAAAWLGIGHGPRTASEGRPRPPAPRPVDDPEKIDENRRRRALARFLAAVPAIAGTPAEDYLAARGLISARVPLSRALRWEPRCFYAGGAAGELPQFHPAMLAAVIEPGSRQFAALHCTYLARIGGQWRKARLDPPRKVWGRYRGCVIPLTRGASGRPLRHAPADDGCLIAEGIENALTGSYLRPELRAFSGLSVGNLATIALPDNQISVCLVRDRDGENNGVRVAYERAVTRWLQEGRGVEFIAPPQGHADANDWLQATLKETST